MVDLDPNALAARGITPKDIVNAVNAQSLTLPSGDAKMGDTQFIVPVNNMAPSIDALNRVPIKQAGGATIYLSDVAHVRGRLGRPTECCAHRRKSFSAFDHHQERECLDS
jgi:multidrug efflux pump subunit AcrB